VVLSRSVVRAAVWLLFTLIGVSLWQLLVPRSIGFVVSCALAVASVAFTFGVIVSLFRLPTSSPRGSLPGVWAGRSTPLTPR